MSRQLPPKVLTIAGSDSGAGAGIQADLKTFAALGVYGTSAITAVTAQNTHGVQAVHALPPAMVAAQIKSVLTDIGTDAVKIGMLANAAIVHAVAEQLDAHQAQQIVLDPVMVAESGDRLLEEDAVAAIRAALLPRCLLVTPNLAEAALLSGKPVNSRDQMEAAGHALLDCGAQAVLVTGGHLPGDEVMDVFVSAEETITVVNKRLPVSGHGTGCTLSSAIAAFLARGLSLPDALKEATAYVHEALVHGIPVGGGSATVLEHFWPQRIGS